MKNPHVHLPSLPQRSKAKSTYRHTDLLLEFVELCSYFLFCFLCVFHDAWHFTVSQGFYDGPVASSIALPVSSSTKMFLFQSRFLIIIYQLHLFPGLILHWGLFGKWIRSDRLTQLFTTLCTPDAYLWNFFLVFLWKKNWKRQTDRASVLLRHNEPQVEAENELWHSRFIHLFIGLNDEFHLFICFVYIHIQITNIFTLIL